MFTYLESKLLSFADTLSIELFVFIASFIEEVVAPIPSPTVMVSAGSLAQIQDYALLGLIPLAVIGAAGKTLGALVVYGIADKAEDFVMERFGQFFNVTHEDVKHLGRRLGNGVKDYAIMIALRSFPLVPSVILSAGSGILKIPVRLFIVSTFVGTIIRDGIYLYAGYIGTTAFLSFIEQSDHVESYIGIALLVVLFGILLRYLYKKKKFIVTP